MSIKNVEIHKCYVCNNTEGQKETCYFCQGSGKMLEITTVSYEGFPIMDKSEYPSYIQHLIKTKTK